MKKSPTPWLAASLLLVACQSSRGPQLRLADYTIHPVNLTVTAHGQKTRWYSVVPSGDRCAIDFHGTLVTVSGTRGFRGICSLELLDLDFENAVSDSPPGRLVMTKKGNAVVVESAAMGAGMRADF